MRHAMCIYFAEDDLDDFYCRLTGWNVNIDDECCENFEGE